MISAAMAISVYENLWVEFRQRAFEDTARTQKLVVFFLPTCILRDIVNRFAVIAYNDCMNIQCPDLYVCSGCGQLQHILVINSTSTVNLPLPEHSWYFSNKKKGQVTVICLPHFKLDICGPGQVVRLPFHPALEYLSGIVHCWNLHQSSCMFDNSMV